MFADNRQGIRANPEIGRMAKSDVARVTSKHIPADGKGGKDQSDNSDIGCGRIGDDKWKGYRHGERQYQSDWCRPGLEPRHHCALPEILPSSPCGRTSRMTISSTKNTVLAHVGCHTTEVTSSTTSANTAAMSAPLSDPMPPKIMI